MVSIAEEEVFHQRTLDFDIRITSEGEEYLFVVKDLMSLKEYRLRMNGEEFKE